MVGSLPSLVVWVVACPVLYIYFEQMHAPLSWSLQPPAPDPLRSYGLAFPSSNSLAVF